VRASQADSCAQSHRNTRCIPDGLVYTVNQIAVSQEAFGTISKLLGHANPTITQNIYIHWRDEEVHQPAQRIEILQNLQSGKVTCEPALKSLASD
jgi:hypothetical protein